MTRSPSRIPPTAYTIRSSLKTSVQSSHETRIVSSLISDYPVLLTSEVGLQLVPILRDVAQARQSDEAVIVLDEAACGPAPVANITALLNGAGLAVLGAPIVVSGSESSKSVDEAIRICSELVERGTRRRTMLVAIGGGGICDLVGFVASIFMRGLPYILFPSSLLAQVDAAIGGKVAVNFGGQKNLVGAFAHPSAVVADVSLLETLPPRALSAGIAEVIKVAVIGCPELFDVVERAGSHPASAVLSEIVRLAIAEKLRQLETDPFEVNELDRLLNFGHCVGHAIEAELGYELLHGECVAIGMAVATRISYRLGLCDRGTLDRIQRQLEAYALPTEVPRQSWARVWAHLERIARVRNGNLRLVVPLEIGAATVLPNWPEALSLADVAVRI